MRECMPIRALHGAAFVGAFLSLMMQSGAARASMADQLGLGMPADAAQNEVVFSQQINHLERIDYRSGMVDFELTPFSRPGNGGLALSAGLHLAKKHYWYDKADVYNAPFAAAGNWGISIPRLQIRMIGQPRPAASYQLSGNYLCNTHLTGSTFSNSSLLQPLVRLPGGEEIIFHPRTASTPSTFPAEAKYVSTTMWYIACDANNSAGDSVFRVRSPNGSTYLFDIWSEFRYRGSGTTWWATELYADASKLTDARGNWLTYTFGAPLVTNQSGSNPAFALTQRFLQSIQASDGRTATFQYATGLSGAAFQSVPRLQSVTSEGRTWTLGYRNVALTSIGTFQELERITNPDGSVWVLDYSTQPRIINVAYRPVSNITTPLGSSFAYTYNVETRGQLTAGAWSTLITRDPVYYSIGTKTISGASLPTLSWQYDFSTTYGSDTNPTFQRGRVRGPRLAEEYVYNFTDRSNNGTDKFLVKEKGQYPPTVNWNNSNYSTLAYRRTLFQYHVFPKIGDFILPGVVIPAWPISPGATTVIDQESGSTFVTSYSEYDEYFNPRAITQSGTSGSRTKHLTYFSNPAAWIIGMSKDETFDGEGTVSRSYYPNGLVSELNKFGVSQTFEYHSTGDLWKTKWRREAGGPELVNELTDYFRGKPRLETHPLGVTITRSVNPTGTIEWERDVLGHQANFLYDSMDRVIEVRLPARTTIAISWPTARKRIATQGNLRETTDFDELGNPMLVQRADLAPGGDTVYLRKRVDPIGGGVEFVASPSRSSNETKGRLTAFDGLNRPLTITDTATGDVTRYCYGTACNVGRAGKPQVGFGVLMVERDGFEKVFEYRAFGDPAIKELVVEHEQVSATPLRYVRTDIARNSINQITSVSQGGVTRTFDYNSAKLPWHVTEPETGTTTLTYDLQGNVRTRTVGTGGVTTMTYDDLNRIDYVDYPQSTSPDVDFEYYQNGNLESVASSSARWDYTYDDANALRTEQLTAAGQVMLMQYEYDGLGAMRTATYPDGLNINYAPDALGRPTQVGTFATQLQYHPNGQLSFMRAGNGVETTITLTPQQLVDRITVSPRPGWTLSDLDHNYDAMLNTSGIADLRNPSRSRLMQYDGLGRLVSASGRWGAAAYSYDDTGNVLTASVGGAPNTYHYSPSTNRLDSISGAQPRSFSYDLYGNVTSDGAYTFQYNDLGQMVSVTSLPGVLYRYDGNGNRTTTTSNGETTNWLYGKSGLLLHSRNVTRDIRTNYFYVGPTLVARREVGAGVNPDADGDGIPDHIERRNALNPANPSDASLDADADGVSNLLEYQQGTSIVSSDTDGDGMPDGFELRFGLDAFSNDAATDRDGDSLTNLQEFQLRTDPNDVDTDNDGVADNVDPAPRFNPAILPAILSILGD
jgi:YD repeat-containing protein